MGPQDFSYESEFAMALAAAAFAIHSVDQEANSEYHNKLRDGTRSMSRVKTRKDDPFRPPESSGILSRRFSGMGAKDAGHVMGGDESQRRNSTRRRRSVEAKANANSWEISAMAKIVKRYEKINSGILAWEKEKKMKAKAEMERKERELEMRRARNVQHYKDKVARIDHIAGGARVQLEDKRRNEEYEVKERAKRIGSKGKLRFTCFCF